MKRIILIFLVIVLSVASGFAQESSLNKIKVAVYCNGYTKQIAKNIVSNLYKKEEIIVIDCVDSLPKHIESGFFYAGYRFDDSICSHSQKYDTDFVLYTSLTMTSSSDFLIDIILLDAKIALKKEEYSLWRSHDAQKDANSIINKLFNETKIKELLNIKEHQNGKIFVPEMVFVKGGKFKMLYIDLETEVADFYIGKYEILVEQFKDFTYETNYVTEKELQNGWRNYWRDPSEEMNDSSPVTHITLLDALEYCKWLSKKQV